MSIVSKTKLKILKVLSKEPLHGYALSKKLGITISSVYAHLSELEVEGFIVHKIEENRKVYKLTEKGKKFLLLLDET
ncbi:MAG TPA: ArsR family transcriptional regulator [bacterium (Candidatus Stahlbacteria)]|nr:ArsR family transcriptional regulator [Candidatus Stahlbacteria bacterium]